MNRLLCIVILFWGASFGGFSQGTPVDSARTIHAIGGFIGVQNSAGDLAKRFGVGGIVGGGYYLKSEQNWVLKVDGAFFFGNQVREDSILNGISADNGQMIARDGNLLFPRIFQRGYTITAEAGKLIPIKKRLANSGLEVLGGVGFMEHKIRIEDELDQLPQIRGEYKKGYDRLTNGIVFSQQVGYRYFSPYKLINYYIGFTVAQGFTALRRDYQFDQKEPDFGTRIDIMYSLRLAWYFPMSKRRPREFYYY